MVARFHHRSPLLALIVLIAISAVSPTRATDDDKAPRERQRQQWRISEFAPDAGLQRQNIFTIDFEANGTLWAAASGGLFRYDGYQWKRFGPEEGLPSHFVRAVLVAHTGELWVGTDKGVGTFDGSHFDRKGSDQGLPGPSVRRIIEDPDGTIWFCCDRWPDASLGGGIASYRKGVWRSYSMMDGLPSDHVYNYFHDASGRQFAMTQKGVAQLFGDRWRRPEHDSVGLADAECWSMAQTPTMGIVARASAGVFVDRGMGWQRLDIPSSRHYGMTPSLTTTRDGEIVTCDFNGSQFGFFRWAGTDIEPISPAVAPGDHSIEYLREAPDGSIWSCTYGSLIRWTRAGGEWTEYANLPFPRVVDRQGRIWFVDRNTAYRLDAGRFEHVPEFAGFVALDGTGQVWSWNATDRILLCGSNTSTFGEADTGLHRVRACTLDAAGQSWFDGEDAEGHRVATVYDGSRWTEIPLTGLDVQPVVESSADPVSGVWYLAIESNQREVTCVHADRSGITRITTAYGGIVYDTPHLAVDHSGALWLSGQAGMYRLDPRGGSGWSQVTAIAGNDVGKGLPRGDEIWFPYNGWTGGESGFAVCRGSQWQYFTGDYDNLFQTTPDGTLYVGIEEGMNIVGTGNDTSPAQLTLPAGQRVHSLVKMPNGDLWMGVVQPDGSGPSVLRYRTDHVAPQTALTSVSTEARQDGQLLVRAVGLERFVPLSRAGKFRFSWKFDDGAWSAFQSLPADGFPMKGFAVGTHRFQLRAQDEGFDVDPTPAERTFAVLPIPLQERAWFKPAVLAMFVLILVLAVFAAERARRFARANLLLERAHEQLEKRVAERTAELSQSNQQLAAEVVHRKHAQGELESMQGRLLETSRRAGMAEVATSVLHNVGNVLNSVNVTANLVIERVKGSKAASLERLYQLLEEHAADLGNFLTNDPRGQRVPEYIGKLAETIAAEQKFTLEELEQLRRHVDHINQIVMMQQTYATIAGVVETVAVTDMVEDALRMNFAALERHNVKLARDYQVQTEIKIERHKVLQILVNLIRNAKYACDDGGREDKQITVRIAAAGENVAIAVIDNGVGIAPEMQTRIFSHGFTTRKNGHGFGLHSGSLTAKELGGELTVHSEGRGQGAMFTLTLPPSPPSNGGANIARTTSRTG